MPDKKVLLRDIDSKRTHPFEPAHAEALLAYPGTRWQKPDEQKAELAGPGHKKPASPEVDATGHATEV